MLDLEGKFLVSKPTMRDARFRESVILVVEHSRSHSMGLIINKPVHSPSPIELAKDFGIGTVKRQPNQYVFYGGPVALNKVIVLHTPDWSSGSTTHKFNDEIYATNSQDCLIACMTHGATGPSDFLICIGQCQWGAGQLEAEILSRNGRLTTDAWLTTSMNANTVFGMKYRNRWKKTVNKVAQEQFNRTFNHAVQTQ
jgi:putative transcriptional regulator|tara:strand:- start:690 stop:1280 length:591 start_codon:yes stop_codon:yes gene_type:complete